MITLKHHHKNENLFFNNFFRKKVFLNFYLINAAKLLLENILSSRSFKSILKQCSKHHGVLFISFSITLPEIKISSFTHPSLETLRFDNPLML